MNVVLRDCNATTPPYSALSLMLTVGNTFYTSVEGTSICLPTTSSIGQASDIVTGSGSTTPLRSK
ncbi:hypothetical protein EGR_05423 [Echinococcus granulosus]|uniref:Uncharacterized protein n=1 Tax=Echinococcus granulosus TaxID=6210 RepID=W6UFJ9_ECHGR|nr:hypothetical protein EGR_05423 [Echinococcus granulosus]EUB59661.1 hypothetical protein EGR_05423 [Echinococcus granulosus]